jgi:Immunity protein 40
MECGVDEVLRQILSVGKSLEKQGSNNWALNRAATFGAIDAIERESRVVLGGDVWLATEGAFSVTGDSWHFDPNPGDSHQINVRDSAAKAREYVRAYPKRGDAVHFELVVE